MAKLVMVSIFDVKVEAFGPPFVCNTRGQAIRQFGDILRDTSLPFVKHVDDYKLYMVGEFDIVSGQCSNGSVPVLLANGSDEGVV